MTCRLQASACPLAYKDEMLFPTSVPVSLNLKDVF